MRICSAPGKVILFGEHAVVFGKPALAMAIDRRIAASVKVSDSYLVNGHPMKNTHHAYISAALDVAWSGPPVMVETRSEIPSGSGLGSSAAVTVSSIAALLLERGEFSPEVVAKKAFEVELKVQRRASPTDTSTSSHGHAVLVSSERSDGFLWSIEKGERTWNVHHREIPPLSFVVGHTGVRASTGPLVDKVRKRVESDEDAARAIDRIGEIVLDGTDAVRAGDKVRIGRLMNENHELLNLLGVGHRTLTKLVETCRDISYGAKMTGAGGGGSMVALTDDSGAVCEAIEAAGGTAIPVSAGVEGVRVDDSWPPGARAKR